MAIGVPGLLDKVIENEFSRGERTLKLDNLSRRPFDSQGFQHVPVKGDLKIETSFQRILATANIREVINNEGEYDSEKIKRIANSAYKVEITGANRYLPGQWITLYSYPGDEFPGWSFHCILD